MTIEDPRVSAEDRAWILAAEHYEDNLCPCGCGFPFSVATAPENEGRFTAEPPFRCHARTALLLEQEQFGNDAPQQAALLWESPSLRSG